MRIKALALLFLFLGQNLFSLGQTGGDSVQEKFSDKYVAGFIPSSAPNIYGLAIGPVGSEAICDVTHTRYSHGLNLQLPGQGVLQMFYIFYPPYRKAYRSHDASQILYYADTAMVRAVHNGLLVSPLGTFTDKINGVSLSLWMSKGKSISGVSINPLWNAYIRQKGITIGLVNSTVQAKGLQIGLVNKTINLRGIQLGLWNVNEKRSLPLINWSFGE
ncbi:MAG: hypothetical protein K9J27_04460 [Bacteroidales bacterium]|nr:hypothetical protein [Bacteroidales bacterium]MCF8333175.1 hypothetical protein [Bacteroidales bacterium]